MKERSRRKKNYDGSVMTALRCTNYCQMDERSNERMPHNRKLLFNFFIRVVAARAPIARRPTDRPSDSKKKNGKFHVYCVLNQ